MTAMPTRCYMVWDPLHESEDDATQCDAVNEEAAALYYARGDQDGLADGIYCTGRLGRGHILHVRAPDRELRPMRVIVEYEPSFHVEPAS